MRITGVFLLVMVMAMAGCQKHIKSSLPPSEMLMHPGPGVDGPGPGVMVYQPPTPQMAVSSQIYFVGPEGTTVQWDVTAPGRFDSESLVAPARYNFPQGALYRLKLANIPGRPGVELYPTLEVGFALPRTEAFLAHNAIPVQFTEEDFDQVLSGNFVTKVIYLPDPEFQELALAGVETLVSTRLDPGVDPITEADRRGAILAIVRLGNKDLQIASAGGVQEQGIQQASYQVHGPGAPGCPPGACGYGGGMPMGYVAGVTAPQYGMPITGTPIGLPGPPHVPLGIPAGLQSHSIVNHTRTHLPEPTRDVRVDVKQTPGISYPAPANHARIVERTSAAGGAFHRPLSDRHQVIDETCDGSCPKGSCLKGSCLKGTCPTGVCPTASDPASPSDSGTSSPSQPCAAGAAAGTTTN